MTDGNLPLTQLDREARAAALVPPISEGRLAQILEVSRMLAVTTELDALLTRIAEAATKLLRCERASIFLHDATRDELWTKVALGSSEIRVPAGAGIVGHVFGHNAVLHVPRPYEDPRFNSAPDQRSGFVTRNLLGAPMVDIDRRPVGVIQAVNALAPDGFGPAEEALVQLLADQAGVAIQRYRLQQEALAAQYMRHEMDLAQRVQQAMIPKTSPVVPGLECAGWTRAASQTGGDCFDLWKTPDGRLGVFVGDASGHGIGPAIMVSQTRTLLRALCETTSDPHELLERANARLSEDLAPGTFITAFLAFAHGDGTVHWSSAGHAPLLVRDSLGESLRELGAPAPPLGVISDFSGERMPPLRLGPGGVLAVLSDGVFDARSPVDDMFDVAGVRDLLDERREDRCADVVTALRSRLFTFQGKEEPVDDQTVVLVRAV